MPEKIEIGDNFHCLQVQIITTTKILRPILPKILLITLSKYLVQLSISEFSIVLQIFLENLKSHPHLIHEASNSLIIAETSKVFLNGIENTSKHQRHTDRPLHSTPMVLPQVFVLVPAYTCPINVATSPRFDYSIRYHHFLVLVGRSCVVAPSSWRLLVAIGQYRVNDRNVTLSYNNLYFIYCNSLITI